MFALEPLGFVVSSFLFLVAAMFALGERRILRTLVVSAVSLAVHLRDLPDRVLGRAAGRHPAGSAPMTQSLVAPAWEHAMTERCRYFFMSWTDPYLLFLTAAGTFAGIYIGAIPGLSVTMAVSILISFTFKWHVNEALALIAGIYLGGVYGGSRSAILLNIPGAPAAIATALDGYPLAKRGEAGTAIGLTTVVSVFGGFIGIAALAVGAPVLSNLALLFAPRDYLMLAIWGILLVGSLSGESLAKGIFAGALGVLIGMVGLDPMTAEGRFTFGVVELTGGIPYVAAMIGFFGVVRGAGAAALAGGHAGAPGRHQDHPVVGAAEEVPAAVAALLDDRRVHRRAARRRRRHRRADGLRPRQAHDQESVAAVRPGGLRGHRRARRPPTTRRCRASTSRC